MDVVWTVTHARITGAERCVLSTVGGGWRLVGEVVASSDGTPIDVGYRVDVDPAWRTRSVRVLADRLTAPRRMELVRTDDGRWQVDGEPRPDLAGCVDVDLGISPSTNTLPIRRLGLEVGDRADVRVAWVRFPRLRVEAGSQRYERRAANLWRYSSEGFTADLVVDEDGLVVTYGDGLWRQVR